MSKSIIFVFRRRGLFFAFVETTFLCLCSRIASIDALGEVPLLDVDDTSLSIFRDGLKAMVLDYDGTLREFTSDPEAAVPSDELLQEFASFEARSDLKVAIISSRPKAFLEKHFSRFKSIQLIAERGVWIMTGGVWQRDPSVDNSWMDDVEHIMRKYNRIVEGSFVEKKDASMVWHFRLAPNASLALQEAYSLHLTLRSLALPGILVQMSDHEKVVEVNSNTLTKGRAFSRFLGDPGLYTSVLVAGDGSADESMFEAGSSLNFRSPSVLLSVKIDPDAGNSTTTYQRTAAKYKLRSPKDLRQLFKNVASHTLPTYVFAYSRL